MLRKVETSTTPRGRTRITAVLVLLWVAWVLVPLGLAVTAFLSVLTFFGEQPTAAEKDHAARLLVAAVLTAVAIPVLGILLSARTDRRKSAVAFCIALSLGLLSSVPVFVAIESDREPSAVPSHSGGGCQEHSGGDTRCPGG